MKRIDLLFNDCNMTKELKSRLKKVEDYNSLKLGDLLFHDTDNSITNENIFMEFDRENNLVTYKNALTDRCYTMSATGWYYLNHLDVLEVEDLFKPRLYQIQDKLFVSNRKMLEEDLLELGYKHLEATEVNSVGDFDIVIR